LIKKGDDANIRALQQEIEARDRMDSERSASPLKAADDAITLDTTLMSIDDVVSTVLAMAAERGLSAE
jgi:cytidylate kinase